MTQGATGTKPVILYDAAGNPMPILNGAAVGSTSGLLVAGTDGTDAVFLTMKDASTAAAAADPSAVVALSPNSHMKSTVEPLYGANNQALTITLTTLATGSARGSTAVSNTTTLYQDVYLFLKFTTGTGTASATGYIAVYGYGSVDGGSTYTESFGGTDAAVTLTVPPNAVLLAQVNAVAQSTTYRAGPISFCRAYGLDQMFANWGVFVVNQSNLPLGAAGTSAVTYQGVNAQNV